MKTFKEHSTYFNLPVLTEEEFEDLVFILLEESDPEGYYDRVKKQMGEQLGPLLGKGSSRVAHAGGDKTIKLRKYRKDGSYTVEDHTVPVVGKYAIKHYTSIDSVREPHEMMLGQMQNLNEAHPHFDHLRTYIKHEDGTYSANPHGVLPTVFHTDPEGRFIISERVKPVTDKSFRELTGIHPNDVQQFLTERFNDARRGLSPTKRAINIQGHKKYAPHNLTNDHPDIKSLMELVDKGLHPGDFDEGNRGVTINHPHGPKIVISDAGFIHPRVNVPGLHNTVAEYSHRESLKEAANREKARLGIERTKY